MYEYIYLLYMHYMRLVKVTVQSEEFQTTISMFLINSRVYDLNIEDSSGYMRLYRALFLLFQEMSDGTRPFFFNQSSQSADEAVADISPDLLERCHSESATISSHLELCGAFKCGRRSQARSFESHTPETSQPGFLASLPYQLNSVCQHVHGATRKADGEREREIPRPRSKEKEAWGAVGHATTIIDLESPPRRRQEGSLSLSEGNSC